MALDFSARLASIRSTPSRADDVDTVTRIVLEAHDLEGVEWLTNRLGQDLAISVGSPTRLPLDEALEDLDGPVELKGFDSPDEPGHNGTVEVSAGRRRRGTVSSEKG
jgi:hypothetical protein